MSPSHGEEPGSIPGVATILRLRVFRPVDTMKKQEKKQGLVDRLKVAASVDEITSLLKEGETYDMASKAIKRRWKRLAERRTKALSAPPSKEDTSSVPASDKKTAKPKSRSGK